MTYSARERARIRFREWVDKSGPTQKEIGAQLGRDQPGMSKLLAYGPRLEDLDKIARVTGLDPSYFVVPDGVVVKPADGLAPHEREVVRIMRDCSEARREAIIRHARFSAAEEKGGVTIARKAAR